MRKLGITFFALIIILGLGFFFRNEVFDFYARLTTELPKVEEKFSEPIKEELIRKQVEIKEEIKKESFLPPPLRAKKDYPEAFLTKEGVIKWTNIQREKYGFPPLKENEQLNLSAAIKIEDMLENQHFSHYSPEGKETSDFIKQTGYEFILIGENLAMGNFLNDEALVAGWMNSPGHKENILNSRYQEIGVAVKKASFEGKTTWMAVQHFGLPASFCPKPDEGLKAEIEAKEEEIESLAKTLTDFQTEIDAFEPKRGEGFKEKVEGYNNLVNQYNSLVEEVKSLIESYNHQVELFNQCVTSLLPPGRWNR